MRKSISGEWTFASLKLADQPFDLIHDGEGDGGSNNNGSGNNNSNNDSSNNNSDYINKNVVNTIIADRDKAKADLAEAKKTIDELNKTKAALDELTGGNLDEFKKTLEELRESKKKSDEATKTEIEKAQAALKEAQDGHTKAISKLEGEHKTTIEALNKTITDQKENIATLQSYKLTSEIYKAAVENNAANPDQIVLMLKGQFALNDKGEFTISVKDKKTGQDIPYGVAEYTKMFLAEEGNKNLLATDDGGKGPRHTNIKPKAPGEPDKKDDKKSENKDGKTWLEKLGRPITDAERSMYRIQGLSDEEIAMNIVLRQQAQERVREARKGKDSLFGESPY